MPTPKPNESQAAYVHRAMPQLMAEGYPQRQSLAIAFSKWRRRGKKNKKSLPWINIKSTPRTPQPTWGQKADAISPAMSSVDATAGGAFRAPPSFLWGAKPFHRRKLKKKGSVESDTKQGPGHLITLEEVRKRGAAALERNEPALVDPKSLEELDARTKDLGPGWSYKIASQQLNGNGYALDFANYGEPQFNEEELSITFVFAASHGRDRVGDFLDVAGIDTTNHRKNPIAFLDHGKGWPLPIGKCEDPQGNYTVTIDADRGLAICTVYLDRDEKTANGKMARQVFSLFKSGILRAGSIGYRPLETPKKLPADPKTGTPAGVFLARTELLEPTICALPCNGDAVVRRTLDHGWEGKGEWEPQIKSMLKEMAGKAEKKPEGDTHWITIGGHPDPKTGAQHAGGVPVKISGSGEIVGGKVPRSLHGTEVGKFGSNIREHRAGQKKPEATEGKPAEEKPKHKIEKVKDKFFGTLYKVGDQTFSSQEDAEDFIRGEEAGHGPHNTEWWSNASSEEKIKWARRHVPGWLSMGVRGQNDWLRETNGRAIEAKRKLDAEKKQKENAERAAEINKQAQAEKEAHKAATKYKPKREYKPGTFSVYHGRDEEPGKVEGIGGGGLFAHRGEHGWGISHTQSGMRIGGNYPSRGAAMMAMDRLHDTGIDWNKPSSELESSVTGQGAHKIRHALDLSQPMSHQQPTEAKKPEEKAKPAAEKHTRATEVLDEIIDNERSRWGGDTPVVGSSISIRQLYDRLSMPKEDVDKAVSQLEAEGVLRRAKDRTGSGDILTIAKEPTASKGKKSLWSAWRSRR